MRTKTKRFAGLASAASLVAVLLPGATTTASALACSGGAMNVMRNGASNETIALKTLHIQIKPPKKVYKIGQVVKIPVTVTRPGEEDPLDMGQPVERPFVMPAEDVNVGVGLVVNDVFLPGFGITDAEGKTTIKIKVEKWVKPGKAHASFYAWRVPTVGPVALETVCARVEEWGFRPIPNLFKVIRQ